jgi:hypothetical protein
MQLARRVITSRCHEGNKARLDGYVGADNRPAVAACWAGCRKADGAAGRDLASTGAHADEHGGLPSLA